MRCRLLLSMFAVVLSLSFCSACCLSDRDLRIPKSAPALQVWESVGGGADRSFRGQPLSLEAAPMLAWKRQVLTEKRKYLDGLVTSRDRAFLLMRGRRAPSDAGQQARSYVLCLALADGKVQWQGELPKHTAIGCAGDRVYLASEAGLLCLDAADGRMKWHTALSLGKRAYCLDLLFGADKVYVTFSGGEAIAFDRRTGERRWQRKIPGLDRGLLTLSAGVLMVVSDTSAAIVGLSAKDGSVLWRSELPRTTGGGKAAATSLPSAALKALYVSAGGGLGGHLRPYLVALDMASGDVRRRVDLGAERVAGCLANDAEHVYAGLASGEVLCYRLQSGRQVWSCKPAAKEKKAAYPYVGRLVVCGDTVLASTASREVAGISTKNGQVRWRLSFKEDFGETGMVVAGGRILIPNGKDIWAYRAPPADSQP